MASMVFRDDRVIGRDEVYYRSRAVGPDGKPMVIVIVNMSAMGLMARCDAACVAGDQITLTLPFVGTITAEVRWSLGGRIGCEMTKPIDRANYAPLLAAMLQQR